MPPPHDWSVAAIVAANDAQAATATARRRSHRKSRVGCAECKRRHIRCDKLRPVCDHCTAA